MIRSNLHCNSKSAENKMIKPFFARKKPVTNAETDPTVPGAGRYRPIGPRVANCAKNTDIILAFQIR